MYMCTISISWDIDLCAYCQLLATAVHAHSLIVIGNQLDDVRCLEAGVSSPWAMKRCTHNYILLYGL